MFKKENGASLAQYGILLGILCFILVPAFWLQGNVIKTYFENFLNGLKNSSTASVSGNTGNTGNNSNPNDSGDPGTSETSSTGPLGGTPEAPVRDCTGDTCTIDFGSFSLNGIKDNYPEFVETAGTAAGTENLIALLEQVADDPNLSTDLSDLIRELATRGHSLATSQRSVEDMVDGISSTDYSTWARDGYRSIENNTSFSDQYDTVMQALSNSGDVNLQNVRSIVDVLSNEIIQMNDTLTDKCTLVDTIVSDLRLGQGTTQNLDNEIYTLLHPSASLTTDVDSAIICDTGNGQDNGAECN